MEAALPNYDGGLSEDEPQGLWTLLGRPPMLITCSKITPETCLVLHNLQQLHVPSPAFT